MYPVGLRPFLDYAVRNLVQSPGFDPARDRLTLVVGHLEEQVRAWFGDAYRVDIARNVDVVGDQAAGERSAAPAGPTALPIRYVTQQEALGTGHALHVAMEAIRPSEPLIAWLADLYVPPELFAAVRAHDSENVLTIGPDPHHDNPNVAVTRDGERLSRVWRGDGPDYDIGLWKLAPDVLRAMLERQVDEFRALPALQHLIDTDRARVGWVRANEWIHLGGTAPTPEVNVRHVVRRLFELEAANEDAATHPDAPADSVAGTTARTNPHGQSDLDAP